MNSREFENGTRAIAQSEAARLLAALTQMQISRKLPIASWVLSAFTPNVDGQVTVHERDQHGGYTHNDKESIENVHAWARAFGVNPLYVKWQTEPEHGEIFVSVVEDGIVVHIWACVTADAITR